ncbi:uncharacterized protein LOC134504900 [Candoia aspera]|uniref:uncharacterized protein LOC134504900 n=1 Tax=Candoia aspera TaxID=51853 RepID=UPI002FD7AEFF
MFGWSARPWFYNSAHPAEKKRRNWNCCLDNILSNQRERIAKELDVQKVLSPLACKGVLSWEEYQDVACCEEQAASLLEKLACKGPGALSVFCSILEDVCPHLLISILLDSPGGFSQTFSENNPESSKTRRASEMDNHDPTETSDAEGSSSFEDLLNHSFNKHRVTPSSENPSGSNCSVSQGKPSLRRIKGRTHRSKSLDSLDLCEFNEEKI